MHPSQRLQFGCSSQACALFLQILPINSCVLHYRVSAVLSLPAMGTLGVRVAQFVRAGYKRLWVWLPYGPSIWESDSMICGWFQHRIFCDSEIHFHIMSGETALLLLRHRDTVKAENYHMDCLVFFMWWKAEVAGNWKYEGKEDFTPNLRVVQLCSKWSSSLSDIAQSGPLGREFLHLGGQDRDSEKFQLIWLKECNNFVFDPWFGQKPMRGHFINHCSMPSWSRQWTTSAFHWREPEEPKGGTQQPGWSSLAERRLFLVPFVRRFSDGLFSLNAWFILTSTPCFL